VARTVAAALPDGATLVVSSSMPVRDLEWYAAPRTGLRVLSNRGANGIDGVLSTAAGAAVAASATGQPAPTAVLIGDLAFLHDANGLLGLAARGLDLTIVVVDNRGGAIFSFLPQQTALAADRFEQLFGTPHDVAIADLAAAHGIPTVAVHDLEHLGPVVSRLAGAGGTTVVLVETDRAANVAVHDQVHAAVHAALRSSA
jgi:2-succinyl-5-enolpyruvyl-6-hydroxy-3-cyclohexene-1-carboxylate synthase